MIPLLAAHDESSLEVSADTDPTVAESRRDPRSKTREKCATIRKEKRNKKKSRKTIVIIFRDGKKQFIL
jgi:hypothetical protein